MKRCKRYTYRPAGWCLVAVVLGCIMAGCGYMPRTANQMSSNLDARDQALREEIAAGKQELLQQIQEADKHLGKVDEQLGDLERSLDAMKDIEVTLQSVCADMTAVRDDVRLVREGLRASVRKEIGDALLDAGRSLQTGTATR